MQRGLTENYSEHSSSLVLLNEVNQNASSLQLQTQQSQVTVNMEVLLGELSDIKAENGILNEEVSLMSKEISSEVFFNVLEGHSSLVYDNDTEDARVISITQEIEGSEIAYDSIIEQLVEEEDEYYYEANLASDSNLT